MLISVVPDSIKDFTYSYPDQGATMADIDKRNATLRAEKKNILSEPNIGDLKTHKWYTDEIFAQQQFTGTNPVTIQLASTAWIQGFTKAATSQNLTEYVALLDSASKTSSLYVQDCGYYRSVLGVSANAEFKADNTPKDKPRYASSSVTLFHLTDSGKLHPLAIVVDFKGSIENSVTIFNTRKSPDEQTDQANDWPWRYAKSVAQSSDWLQHELTVHLTNCHLVEEATIVGSFQSNLTFQHKLENFQWKMVFIINSDPTFVIKNITRFMLTRNRSLASGHWRQITSFTDASNRTGLKRCR